MMLGLLLHQDLAVVADHPVVNAAVVVLVADAPAAAGVVHVVDDQALFVAVLVALPAHGPAAGGPLALEAGARGRHRLPSVTGSRAGGPAGPRGSARGPC